MGDNVRRTSNNHPSPNSLVPTLGSRLTYREVADGGPAQDPPISCVRDRPVIHLCGNVSNASLQLPNGADRNDYPPIALVGTHQAYGIFEHKVVNLDHHYPGWGCVYTDVLVYPRADQPTRSKASNKSTNESNKEYYIAPSSIEGAEFVAIKKLNKSRVLQFLSASNNATSIGIENPFIEIARMQELGDNIHVLSCIEALQDFDHENNDNSNNNCDCGYLYIVMPRAYMKIGSLKDYIPWRVGSNTRNVNANNDDNNSISAHTVFKKLLQILVYLEQHNICHRDLSPDNFLFLSPTNLVVADLALSIRIPTTSDSNNNYLTTSNKGGSNKRRSFFVGAQNQRTLITNQGNFGTVAWMSPEIYHSRTFDAVFTDLWQISVVLYNMLTGRILYHRPDPTDISFVYYVVARGLSSTPINEMTIDVLSQFFSPSSSGTSQQQEMHVELLNRAMAHLELGEYSIEILENLLHVNVNSRWTLGQAIESYYVQYGSVPTRITGDDEGNDNEW